MIVVNGLRRFYNKMIKYDNTFPLKIGRFLTEIQVKYVQDMIIARNMAKIGMETKDMIQVISDI